MCPLSDLFPESYRSDFSIRIINPGQVFRFHSTVTNPPKIKICVLLAVNNSLATVGYLFINSEINPHIFDNLSLRSLLLSLPRQDLPFLDHDSWLDCSHIHEIRLEEIQRIVAENPSCHLGNLSQSLFESSIQLIRNAPTIPRKVLVKYFGS